VAADASAVYFSDLLNQRVRGVFNGPPPVLPESRWAILFPLGALALVGIGGLLMIRRRGRVAT
jgi:MYXO-CTERM domain-containing protein